MGGSDFIEIREYQGKGQIHGFQIFSDSIDFTADVLGGPLNHRKDVLILLLMHDTDFYK
jgi:hypothetical protein